NSDQDKKGYKHLLKKSKVSFKLKYALRSLIGNPSRSFVVFLGIFLGNYIALLGYSLLDTMEYTKQNMVDEMGSYEYQYVLNELIVDNTYGGETVVMSAVENEKGEQISLIGTSKDNLYLDLRDKEGTQVDIENGYYITNVIATLNGIEKGDEMILKNPLTLEEYRITVAGIIDNDMQNAIFTSKEKATKMLGIDAEASNVIMSDVSLDIPEEKIIQTIKKSDAKEQFQNMSNMMDVMIGFVIALGALICVASIYVAVNMLVTENRSNISMLKVLGYDDRKINRIVLSVNHILVPIGIGVSIPLVFGSANWFMAWLAEFIGVLPQAYIAPKSFVYTIILTCASYFGSLMLLRRKVSKVDMVESLKDNRE
ncbi:MAG: hypothetical protein IJY10_07170, partial [Lachnospiraceae bacterium]|nr:hypothetical protein [Lachnospiraceae bacterium]